MTASEQTKVCPQCAEEVKAEAKVCRFCSHRFDAPAVSRTSRRIRPLAFVGLGALLIAAVVIALVVSSSGGGDGLLESTETTQTEETQNGGLTDTTGGICITTPAGTEVCGYAAGRYCNDQAGSFEDPNLPEGVARKCLEMDAEQYQGDP